VQELVYGEGILVAMQEGKHRSITERRLVQGILNYVILRPILAAMGMAGITWGFYNSGSVVGVWFWIFLINNFSQIWAIYCLVMFYRATKDDLSPIRPVSKFLLIKAVVFLTFWQSIAISMFFSLGIVKTDKWTTYDTEDVAAGVQDFFICIEMFVAALLFAYAFPPKDYMDEDDTGNGFIKNMFSMLDVRDVVEDVSGKRTKLQLFDLPLFFHRTLRRRHESKQGAGG